MNAFAIVAGKEFRDGLRNRWAFAITLVFAALAIGIAYFGAAASGTVGFTSLSTTMVSLASLAVFLVPLIALLLSHDAVVGERERGTLLLLLSYPLSPAQLLFGKFAGQAAVLGLATSLGFGVAAVAIGLSGAPVATATLAGAFAVFIGSATLLGCVFLGIGFLVSVAAGETSRAAGLALIVWFFFVLVFDLGLLALLAGSEGGLSEGLVGNLLLLNPTDLFRLINLSGLDATQAISGTVAAAGRDAAPVTLLLGAMGAWLLAPLFLATWLFHRRRL